MRMAAKTSEGITVRARVRQWLVVVASVSVRMSARVSVRVVVMVTEVFRWFRLEEVEGDTERLRLQPLRRVRD